MAQIHSDTRCGYTFPGL